MSAARGLIPAALLAGACLLSAPAHAATIVMQVADGAGEGFNDPDPPANANQKGNNPGTSLGELRLNLFNAAAQIWAGILDSTIAITISGQFNPLFCSPGSATLGQAGSTGSQANFGAGFPNVAYHVSLAEALASSNLNGASAEINAMFNSDVDDDGTCLGGGGFYYGTDGNPPAGTTELFPVVLHELAHGLGFAALYNTGTGAFIGAGAFPDAFSRNLMDLESGKSWDAMTDGERLASATNDPDLVWKGAIATADQVNWLDHIPEIVINAPGGIAGTHDSNMGEESTIVLPGGGVTGGMADGNALVGDACANVPAGVGGKIVLYDLPGGCNAAFPAFLAQVGGASGVIIRNPVAGSLPDMSGIISNQDITIPYVGATQAVGNDLRTNIATANVTIQYGNTLLAGENAGKLRMFAPSVLVPGSSVSHWTSDVRPDLLMESKKGDLANDQTDITPAAFVDMGWTLMTGNPQLIHEDGFEAGGP